jgi:hypothetical protein
MDTALLAKSLGVGFATGISTLVFITLTVLPASYVMNKFVHHGPLMRVLLGVLTGVVSIISVIILFGMILTGKWQKIHYFGLLPTYLATETPGQVEGYMAFFFSILYIVMHPFMMFYLGGDDEAGYINTVQQMLVPETTESKHFGLDGVDLKVYKGAVCEPFSKASRFAGAIEKPADWVRQMTALETSGIGEYIFSPVESQVA